MKVAIIGGGIGGLASALAMTQAGYTVTVHERSKQLVDLGAGITLAPGALRLGSQVDQLELHGENVMLTFAEGHVETAGVVVAVDGIRSAIRETLFSPAPPEFTGFVAWRGLVDATDLPKHLHESAVAFGQGRHINRYLGEPNAGSLKGDEPGAQYAYDAVAGPLGG